MESTEEIFRAIGRLEASVESVAFNQLAHQKRDDEQHSVTQKMIEKLTLHVNDENEKMDKRVELIEIENAQWDKAEAERKAHVKGMWKVTGAVGTIIAFLIGNVVLFLSGTYEHFFGH